MTLFNARSLRIILEIVAALILGFFFVAGVGVYFLSTGPVSIPALTPMIERALNTEQSPYTATIEDTQIVWAGWDRAVDVVARNVTFQEAEEPPIAVIPEISVGVSFRSLLAGEVHLNTLEILNPTLTLLRNPDGSLALSFGDAAQEEEGGSELWTLEGENETGGVIPQPVLNALTAGPDEPGPLGTLNRFSIVNAELQILDRSLGESLWLRGVGLDITRGLSGLDARLVGSLESASDNALIGATLRVLPDLDRIDATLAFERLDTALPIRYLPDLVFYLPDLTIGGQVGASFDLDGIPRRLSAKLDSAAGTIDFTTDILGTLPASETRVSFDAFDTAVWLGGLYDLGDALDYAPRVPVSGSARFVVDDRGLPVSGDADLSSEIGTAIVMINRDPELGTMQLDTTITDLRLDRAATTAPSLGDLENFAIPVNLTAAIALSEAGDLLESSIDFSTGSGVLDIPGIGTLPELTAAQGSLRVAGISGPYFLDALTLDFGSPLVRASGTVNPVEGGHEVTFNGLASDLQMSQLSDFWPADLAPNPREWTIENIPTGHVPQANIALSMHIPAEGVGVLEIETLTGAINLHDAVVHYLRPLTPAIDVSGFAEFTADRFDIDVLGGTVDNAVIHAGRIEMTDLGQAVEKIDIALDIASPMPTALALLDTEPRRYISKIGLDAGLIDGFARAQVGFSFPLLLDLTADQIHYEAEAEISDVRMPDPDLDTIISADTISLSLEPGSMSVSGDVLVGDIPANAEWQEIFDDTSDQKRFLSLTSVSDLSALESFGLDVSDYATGRAGFALNLAEFRSGARSLALTTNLAEATLSIETLNWQKAPGVASELTVQAITRPDGTIRVENFHLNGGEDHDLRGAAELAAGFEDLLAARVDRFRVGRTDISGTVTRVGETYALKLAGPELDAQPFIDDDEEEGEASPPEEEADGPSLQVDGAFERLHLGPDRAIRNADLTFSLEEGEVRSLTMHGLLRDDRKIDVNYIPTPDGGRDLFILAEDTGLALTVADVTGELEGGTLRIEGHRTAPDAPLVGRLEITDFQMREAPRLARILEVISVTGILSALSNEGLHFNTLTANFSMTDEAIVVTDGAARGDSLGITVQGTVDRIRDELDLQGEVAVSDLFSKTIGQLPIIELLVGEGLIGAAYSMTGSIEDPSVTVNPLSVIAPGFLRKVFQGDVEGAPQQDPATTENDR